jgi:hypothetical protein
MNYVKMSRLVSWIPGASSAQRMILDDILKKMKLFYEIVYDMPMVSDISI